MVIFSRYTIAHIIAKNVAVTLAVALLEFLQPLQLSRKDGQDKLFQTDFLWLMK